jgi:hypothetical protein
LTEVAVEVAKKLPTEIAGQAPIIAVFASLVRLTNDVKNDLKAANEKRALWREILSLKKGRNISDDILDSADWINKDDDLINSLTKTILEIADQLISLSSELAKA